MFAIAVHGGAGDWSEGQPAAEAGVRRAVEAGAAIMAAGGSALDAVVAAVVVLEDDPVFNAGTGATLNLRGEVECDAAVMAGEGLRAGAVACVKDVRNPVLLARRVMVETDHVLIAGEGASELAKAWGLATGNEPTVARLEKWQKARAKLPESATKLAALLKAHPHLGEGRHGTVGAVARDTGGLCAAATSTGGVLLKLPGRIGDTPVPGAGTYATPNGAASATGRGELILRSLTTRLACELMAGGLDAQAAATGALERTSREAGSDLGLIVMDSEGSIGVAHATAWMPHATMQEGLPSTVRMKVD